ncbi:efflux RND transporter periplasmic adaptor subunit [Catalinimonas niigatensis]|uniref:efflux RND transporter periplasmic adaptor subunit n=1 Tax=Catalinimonas niigatensis TaxID=1397264 RepID=UPI002666A598|nr:efflux RND transporter periplasmic adaptor subunit [Catalinimonas niigatensis]WPP49699.1 efflux RND transporter periplasmic adaptor subunit [Catalinimonas niigatensis]
MPVKTRKKKKRNPLIIFAVVAVVIIALLFVAKQAGWIGKGDVISVNLAQVKARTIVERVTASGTVQPEREIKISPEVPGEIIELNIEEGDSVAMGQLMLKIRPDNFESVVSRTLATLNQQRANLAQAEASAASAQAQFTQAQAAYERNKSLYQDKVISDADFETAESNFQVARQQVESAKQTVEAARFAVKSAEASVDEARENLSLTNIYAPVGGIVSKLDVEQGERVVGTSQMAGTEMLRLADLNRMEVRVDVNENDIIRVALNDTAIVDVDAYSYMDKEFKGIVTSIASTANEKLTPEAVTEFEVRIRLLNSSYEDLLQTRGPYPFRPGMTASVDIITQKKENVLSVPLAAVTTRPENNPQQDGEQENQDEGQENNTTQEQSSGEEESMMEIVFRMKGENTVERVNVKTGISDYENIEILEGLADGDQVVSGPYIAISQQLNDGSEIKKAEGNGRNFNRASN